MRSCKNLKLVAVSKYTLSVCTVAGQMNTGKQGCEMCKDVNGEGENVMFLSAMDNNITLKEFGKIIMAIILTIVCCHLIVCLFM